MKVEELYLMSLDNDNVRLTNNTVEDSRPIWSLDGKRIAFLSRRRDDNLLDLYIMASDGSKVQRIFDDKSTLGGGFAWAPNSQMLAISTIVLDQSSVNSNPVNELRIINVETKDLILRLSDDQLRYGFDWSYDNNKLVYASEYEIYQNMPIFKKLYTLDIHTGQETQIANFDSVSDPHWSPINNIIAFGGGTFEKGEMNIYLINSDGTNMRQLTEGGFYSLDSWSPDGKKLAIASIKNWRPDSELYILDVESGQLEQMTGNDTYEAYPLWIEF